MRFLFLVLLLAGCAEVTTASIDGGSTADAALTDGGCVSWARPTGTCTHAGVCCVSSTCVDGICR